MKLVVRTSVGGIAARQSKKYIKDVKRKNIQKDVSRENLTMEVVVRSLARKISERRKRKSFDSQLLQLRNHCTSGREEKDPYKSPETSKVALLRVMAYGIKKIRCQDPYGLRQQKNENMTSSLFKLT